MRHWTFGCAMTFGASTTAAAVIAASVPPAVTRNLRRSLVTWASSLRFGQGHTAAVRAVQVIRERSVRRPRTSEEAERGAVVISPWLLPVLEAHVVGADQLVAARLPGHPLVGAVKVDLLVERNGWDLFDPELVDAMVLSEALLLVHLRLRLFDHPVEVLVVPVDEDVG